MAVAVPVRAQGGRVVAALGIGGPRLRLGPERLPSSRSSLAPAAARISERLGHRAEATEPPAPREGRGERGRRETHTREGRR